MENQQPSPKGKVQRLSKAIGSEIRDENKAILREVSRVAPSG